MTSLGNPGRGLKVLSAVAALAGLLMLARLTVFMASASHPEYSTLPGSRWEVRHSCLTAYFVAAEAGARGQSLYEPSLYSMPDGNPAGVRKGRSLGPFNVDVYEYPPPFLLLPRVIMLATPDFMQMRLPWFVLNLGVVLAAMWIVARSMGPPAATRALSLAPLVLVALPTLSALQKGNVQLFIIAISMMAMVLFDRRAYAAGGALLAYATVSKLFPGMLVVYLLARRDWRAVAWTTAMSLVYVLVSAADLGLGVYMAFLEHLPGLLGGEAFPAFRNPAATAINLSIPGLAFKLKLFGVPGMGFGAAKVVGWIWTAVVLWLTVAAARRSLGPAEKPIVWLAILTLATLRSPFLPQAYGAFTPLWLLTLIAALYAPTARMLAVTVGVWLALNVFWPLDWPIDPRWLAVMNGVPQVATIVLAIGVFRRLPAAAPSYLPSLSVTSPTIVSPVAGSTPE